MKARRRRLRCKMLALLVAVATAALFLYWRSTEFLDAGELQLTPAPGARYFFSIGDFGCRACQLAYERGEDFRHGGNGAEICKAAGQQLVADTMDRFAERLKPEIILTLGDNFYLGGVKSLEDRQFNESFEQVYAGPSLRSVPWQVALGDHDQRGNVSALMMYAHRSSRWRLPAPYYRFTLPVLGKAGVTPRTLEVLVTDSVGLEGSVEQSILETRRFAQDYTEEFAGAEAGALQWDWLDRSAEQTASSALRLVVGHRPVLSACTRGRVKAEVAAAERLRMLLRKHACPERPIVYIHGHDHVMQHLREDDGSIHYISNGVGGFKLHGVPEPGSAWAPRQLQWGTGRFHGFIVHEMTRDAMTMYFIEAGSGRVHRSVTVPWATRSAPATPPASDSQPSRLPGVTSAAATSPDAIPA